MTSALSNPRLETALYKIRNIYIIYIKNSECVGVNLKVKHGGARCIGRHHNIHVQANSCVSFAVV